MRCRAGLAVCLGLSLIAAGCGGAATVSTGAPAAATRTAAASTSEAPAATAATSEAPAKGSPAPARPPARRAARADPHPPYGVGEVTLRFVDGSRLVAYPGHRPQPRPLVTVVRYPIAGPASHVDVPGAPADAGAGPFPLIVFGHGFAVTPADYFRLLRAWARAGYVVAAPVFPLENAHAPGGPDESDLVNQPRDVSFVISQLLAASARAGTPLTGAISPTRIAVSGQSDGGETALAVAYDRQFIDHRVRAAAILSGAQIPGVGMLQFSSGGPPLLATQGTADTINPPPLTYQFFAVARRPKYLLALLGAPHLPPYTSEQPQLTIVERVTTAFFDRYLKGQRGGVRRMKRAGDPPGVAALTSDP